MMSRPDMREYFASRIDHYVFGMLAGPSVNWPRDVVRVDGRVVDSIITVTMKDGTIYKWSGGRYAARKKNGCYAPLMPKPIKENA